MQKFKNLKQKLNEIQEAGEGAWEELKAGFEKGWRILGDTVNNAIGNLKG